MEIIEALIIAIALETGVPPFLALSVTLEENQTLDPLAVHVNPNGSRDLGIMQLNDSWYSGEWRDPETNIRAGCLVLKELLAKPDLNVWQAVIAYNCGYHGFKKGRQGHRWNMPVGYSGGGMLIAGIGGKGDFMSYFLPFLGLVSGSGAFLGGRPLPGTLRMASTTDSSYIFVFPAWVLGRISALRRRVFTASKPIPSISAISKTVKPCIYFISDSIQKIFKKNNDFGVIYLDKYTDNGVLYI
jgi:hypothetical protein